MKSGLKVLEPCVGIVKGIRESSSAGIGKLNYWE